MSAEHASYWLCAIWYVTWWIPALWSQKAARRLPAGAGNLDRLITGVGATLVFLVITPRPGRPSLFAPLWTASPTVNWALVLVMLASFAFCWWARVHMGRLWSGLVTVKPDHYVVDTGPFRLVRHPIYSGVIAAALCVALIKATPAALVGEVLFALGFWLTARKEERFLRESLGADAYDAYARKTGMLLPFVG